MILKELFINNFEILIPELFLSIIILILLLFGTFYKSTENNQKILIIKTLNNIIIYLLFICCLLLLNLQQIPIFYPLMNGTLFVDDLSVFIKIILITITIICLIIQQKYLVQQNILSFEILILMVISLLGLMLLTSSFHFITLYLAIEIQSLSFYILTASQKKSSFAIEAAFKYFILGSIASSFILFGTSIVYGVTGSLNFGDIYMILNNLNYVEHIDILFGIFYGLLFILVGILFKTGAVPFHFWLPDVYEGTSNNVTAFFAIVPKIAYVSLLIRFMFDIFSDVSTFFEIIFEICAISSMVIGALSALRQTKVKRLLAYSSISHVGFILIGFTANLYESITYILFYVIIYTITSINLWTTFLVLNINNKPIKYLTDLSNLVSYNKILSFIIVLNLFSMAGIPPLAGFFAKFFIFATAIKANKFGIVFISILVSILSCFYYLKFIKIIFFEKISVLKKNKIRIYNQISKLNSFILIISSQILLFFILYPDFILIFLNKINLLLLI